MKILKSNCKKFSSIFFVIILLCSLIPDPVHAVDPVSAGMALASAMDAYGMAYGIGSVYDVSDANGVVSSFDGLWDEFAQYRSSQGDSYNYQDYYDNFDNNPSVQAFSHSSGKFAGFYIDAESAEVFDKFWNWLLSGPAEMVKVDNAYQWNSENGVIDPVTVYSYDSMAIPYVSTISADATTFDTSLKFAYVNINTLDSPRYQMNGLVSNTGGNCSAFLYYSNTNILQLAVVSLSSGQNVKEIQHNESRNTYNVMFQNYGPTSERQTNEGASYYWWTGSLTWSVPTDYYDFLLPIYPNADAGIDAFLGGYGLSQIKVKPHDENDTAITLPDVTSPDYQPSAKEIITNIPWDDTYDDTDEDENGQPIPYPPSAVTPVIDDMIDSIIEDGFSIEDDPQPSDPDTPPPAPSEVFTPLLPVSPPSFNFNFSGIWHYVREWVSSLGAWFSLVFSVWAILPYAIVVPVYATAVVVIVLGVYKRFFM